MLNLPGLTWIRFGVWMVIGLVIHALYGGRHSRVGVGEGQVRGVAAAGPAGAGSTAERVGAGGTSDRA